MTTTRICTDCHRKLNSSNTSTHHQPDLCDDCYDLAGLEAAHQDGDHDDTPDTECLLCDPNARKDRSRKGHEGTTVAKGSHADCYAAKAHDKSKAGRAGCRKLNAAKD